MYPFCQHELEVTSVINNFKLDLLLWLKCNIHFWLQSIRHLLFAVAFRITLSDVSNTSTWIRILAQFPKFDYCPAPRPWETGGLLYAVKTRHRWSDQVHFLTIGGLHGHRIGITGGTWPPPPPPQLFFHVNLSIIKMYSFYGNWAIKCAFLTNFWTPIKNNYLQIHTVKIYLPQ